MPDTARSDAPCMLAARLLARPTSCGYSSSQTAWFTVVLSLLGVPIEPSRTTVEAPEQISWWANGWGNSQDPTTLGLRPLAILQTALLLLRLPNTSSWASSRRPSGPEHEWKRMWSCSVQRYALTAAAVGVPLRTVYFGGGTPSLVPPPLLGRILATLRAHHG